MAQATFQDEFSAQADDYARYRPGYPETLFAYLAERAPARHQAWDAATGSGQAATALADYFDRVIATDASAEQIQNAQAHERIDYRLARAEDTELPGASIDLITVAQALHWFDLPAFYATARRALKPGGLIAVWCYSLFRCNEKIDAIIDKFYHDTLGAYWPDARRSVESGYRELDFPFEELTMPAFHMQAQWNLDQLLGYISTWSAVARYRRATGLDPLAALRLELAGAWGRGEDAHLVQWPINLRVGRLHA